MEPIDWDALRAPFPASVIQQRPGARGKKLDYIGTRTLMHRLDHVLGPTRGRTSYDNWGEHGVKCRVEIYVDDTVGWLGKENGADRADMEGDKAGYTEAFKRCCQNEWGIGRHLYPEPLENLGKEPGLAADATPPTAANATVEPQRTMQAWRQRLRGMTKVEHLREELRSVGGSLFAERYPSAMADLTEMFTRRAEELTATATAPKAKPKRKAKVKA